MKAIIGVQSLDNFFVKAKILLVGWMLGKSFMSPTLSSRSRRQSRSHLIGQYFHGDKWSLAG
jgi:hypothetical protein